jgi:hypothetical protein
MLKSKFPRIKCVAFGPQKNRLSVFQDALHMCGTQNSSSVLGKVVVIIYKMWVSIEGATTAARVLQALKHYWATSLAATLSFKPPTYREVFDQTGNAMRLVRDNDVESILPTMLDMPDGSQVNLSPGEHFKVVREIVVHLLRLAQRVQHVALAPTTITLYSQLIADLIPCAD